MRHCSTSLLSSLGLVAALSACADGAAPPAASGSADAAGGADSVALETTAADAAGPEATTGDVGVVPDSSSDATDAASSVDGAVADSAPDAGPDSDPDSDSDSDSDSGAGSDSAPTVDSAPDSGPVPDSGPGPDAAPDSAATCKPTTPSVEVCDGVDNDCDGKTDDKLCDDGNACTTDSCAGISGCQFSTAAPCGDGNACTDDSCDAKTGCKNTPNSGSCDDGNACTTELCSGGTCKPTTKACDDGDVCTSDACDPGSGNCLAGQPKSCNDGDACTADTCNENGLCIHAPVANCKTCNNAVNCDDANTCTTDTCVNGKCNNAPAAGCVGPTDYSVEAVTVTTPKVGLGGTVKWEVAYKNAGKKPTSATANAYLSADEAVSGDDLKFHVDTATTGPISVAAATPTKTVAYGASLATNVQDAKHKFVCVQVTWLTGVDPTPANNVKCAAIEMLMPDYEVVAVKPAIDAWFWNWGPYPVTVTFKNVGNGPPVAGLEALVKPSLSGDNLIGVGDLSMGVTGGAPNTGLLAAGASKDMTFNLDLTGNKGSIIANHLCVLLQTGNSLKELNSANNSLCVPLKVLTVPEIALAPVAGPSANPPTQPPGFANAGVWSSAGQYGVTPACMMTNLANLGEAPFANFGARCWLHTGAPGSSNPTKLWEVKATIATAIPPAATQALPFAMPNAVVAGLPDGTVKMGTPVGGAPQPMALTMCMAFNEDGAVVEKLLTNNQTCFGVTLSAVDFGWLEASGPVGPSPNTIAKGTSAQVKKTNVKNFGSAGSKGGTAPATYARLVLS